MQPFLHCQPFHFFSEKWNKMIGDFLDDLEIWNAYINTITLIVCDEQILISYYMLYDLR